MDSHSTIFFADLTGSSRAYESFDNQLVAGAISRITRWISRVCEAHRGRTVKFLGDGVLVQFPAGILAVSAAIYLQHSYAAQLMQLPEAFRMGLKIGMASGEIVQLESDSFGDPVNLAARLCDMAGAHAIWADESVFQMTQRLKEGGDLPQSHPQVRVLRWQEVRRRPLGMIRMPGLSQPRSVFQVLWNVDVGPEALTTPAPLEELQAERPVTSITLTWLDASKVFGEGDGRVRIGRLTGNDVVVADQRVSREHARIDWQDGAFVLTDLSSYGTTVRFADGAGSEVQLRRSNCVLHSSGEIALGVPFSDFSAPVLAFTVHSQDAVSAQQNTLPLFEQR